MDVNESEVLSLRKISDEYHPPHSISQDS